MSTDTGFVHDIIDVLRI